MSPAAVANVSEISASGPVSGSSMTAELAFFNRFVDTVLLRSTDRLLIKSSTSSKTEKLASKAYNKRFFAV